MLTCPSITTYQKILKGIIHVVSSFSCLESIKVELEAAIKVIKPKE